LLFIAVTTLVDLGKDAGNRDDVCPMVSV